MKMWDWIKIFGRPKNKKKYERAYKLSINDVLIENIRAHSTGNHSGTYKILRTFKTPQYDEVYVLRNKKGFNTIGFNIHYDIVVCDKDGKVLDTLADQKEGYISEHYADAHFVYFMTVGSINFYKIKSLDRIRLRKEW